MSRIELRRHFPTFAGLWPRLRAMRLPRIRHKARWAAGLAAVVLLALAWIAVRRHFDSVTYRRVKEAEGYFGRAYDAQQEANALAARMESAGGQADKATFDAYVNALRHRSYFHALTVKYYMAANRPWLPVEPDPPRPE